MGSEVGVETWAAVRTGATSSLCDETLCVLASIAGCRAGVAELAVSAGNTASTSAVDNDLLSTSALVAAKGTFNQIVGSSVASFAGLR